ncbi:MAG: hypothetical protein KC636_25295, partial [Myxococcales bacterium]|nr:hypothetical protein [Myxococcales bacterium]
TDTAGTDTDGLEVVPGCGDATLLVRPEDPAARGPWPVGARTVSVGALTVEVWYPAAPGSEIDVPPVLYDIREQLPPEEAQKLGDVENPWVECACQGELPLDELRGPYPVIAFIHGTAGFRQQSLTHMVHWASRGFVVVAADYPGLKLADMLSLLCPFEASGEQDLRGDTLAVLDAVTAGAGDLAFLSGHVDMDRVALAGHSAGGNAVATNADLPGVQVVIPMASGSAVDQASVASTLFLGADADKVVDFDKTKVAYEASAGPRRLVGIGNTGHLAFSDICSLRAEDGRDLVTVATDAGICGIEFAGALFDCSPAYLPDPDAWAITNYATSAVLEEALHCAAAPDLAAIQTVYPDVAEYREQL